MGRAGWLSYILKSIWYEYPVISKYEFLIFLADFLRLFLFNESSENRYIADASIMLMNSRSIMAGLKMQLKAFVANLPRCFLKNLSRLVSIIIRFFTGICSADLPAVCVIVAFGMKAMRYPACFILKHKSTSS